MIAVKIIVCITLAALIVGAIIICWSLCVMAKRSKAETPETE